METRRVDKTDKKRLLFFVDLIESYFLSRFKMFFFLENVNLLLEKIGVSHLHSFWRRTVKYSKVDEIGDWNGRVNRRRTSGSKVETVRIHTHLEACVCFAALVADSSFALVRSSSALVASSSVCSANFSRSSSTACNWTAACGPHLRQQVNVFIDFSVDHSQFGVAKRRREMARRGKKTKTKLLTNDKKETADKNGGGRW